MTRAFPPPSFSRSQSWASQARSDTTVEDSEPEREERRLKAKTVRRVRRKKTPVVAVASKQAEDVIELTDSGPSRPSTPAPAPRLLNTHPAPLVIIDVSDDNESPTRLDPPGSPPREDDSDHVVVNGLGIEISGDDTLEDESSLPSIRHVLSLPKAREQKHTNVPGSVPLVPPRPAPLLTSTTTSPQLSEDESDSDQSKLKLGRFVYAAPNPLRRTASKTHSPVEPDAQTPEVMSDTKRTPTHRFAEDFTHAQLSRLLKCVSCELAWTARKSVKEKMRHIQSCAKKNRLTDETIRVLLRTELANLPSAPVASSSKSKSPAGPPAPSVPETLLEETLRDKQRKRSGPRLQVQPTVKSVSETRDDILDKARLLLQNGRNGAPAYSAPRQPAEPSTGSAEHDLAIPPPTQAFTKSSVAVRTNDLANVQPADMTQAFGSSRLGVARIQGGIINAGAAIAGESDVSPLTQVFTKSALADVEPPDDMPPATQMFAPSKLTNGGEAARKVVPANGPIDDPTSLYDTSEDDLDPSKSSPARPPVIEIPSSPSSNANLVPTFPTQTSPRAAAAAADPAAPDPRLPSPRARSRSLLAGDERGPPGYYDDGPDFHVQNEYEYLWNEWNHEQNVWDEYGGGGDAFLHYNPDADTHARPLTRLDPSKIPSPPSPPRRRLAAILEDGGPVAGSSRVRDESLPPTEAATKKKKRGRPKKVTTDESDAEPGSGLGKDISQDELNAKLKEAVLQDEVLHLRILRYEPIHFDVFMQLAADAGITEKKTKLKGKVRTFLDRKAIHFYGAEPTKSRTKRTRHP